MKKITVSDITLRNVKEQDLSLTFRERLSIAERLDASMVDAIELPVLSNLKEDEVIYRTISERVKNAVVKIPVGVDAQSLERALVLAKTAKKACLQVIMPVSTALMEYNYHLKAPNMLIKIAELIKNAKNEGFDVEFVAKDAFRAEDGFVVECAKVALENGATAITVCDDAGEALPENYAKLVKELKSAVNVSVYVQPFNNLQMASACAVCAINAGADGVKTSVSGNYLSLAVFADVIRAKKFDLDATCNLDVANAKSITLAIVEAAGDEKEKSLKEEGSAVIDANATIKDISSAIKDLGYELTDSDVGKIYEEFKKLTANKDNIDKKELEAVVASTAMQVPSTYHLVNYFVNSSNAIPATANVTLEKDGEKFTGVSTGDGPIDAAFHAIEQVVGHHYELDDFQVHAVTKGRGAVGSSIIRLRADGKLYPGNGVSTDIIGACIRAYVNALNKIVYEAD